MAYVQEKHHRECVEHDCGGDRRNRYFKGKRMTFEGFALEQEYLIDRRRLLNRSLYGFGVVSGFELHHERSVISSGLALDHHGRELILHERHVLSLDACYIDESCGKSLEEGRWLLQAHYAERPLNEQRIPGSCGCSDLEWNEVCETVVFSLWPLGHEGHCPPGELPCPECHCHHDSTCCRHERHEVIEPRLDQEGDEHHRQEEHERPGHMAHDRDRHRCLCQWINGARFPEEPDALCEWHDRHIAFARKDPVPLACLQLAKDDCGCLQITGIDQCAPRRLVKRNDVLFDLIRGCDLTRIKDVSWSEWHRSPVPVHWKKFREKFHNSHHVPPPPHTPASNPRVTDFTVYFTKEVLARSLTRDCFSISAVVVDKSTGWGTARRVPIIDVATALASDGQREEFTDWATIVIDRDWWDDEVRGTWSSFDDGPTTIEIEVRCDYILDCNRQAVSGAAIGLRHPFASGNGTPGGTFLSVFHLESRNKGP
jgi:hypothetical protein